MGEGINMLISLVIICFICFSFILTAFNESIDIDVLDNVCTEMYGTNYSFSTSHSTYFNLACKNGNIVKIVEPKKRCLQPNNRIRPC